MSFDPARLCPTVTGYRYVTDAGLVRTAMEDGVIRQRRQWTNARATLDLRFVFTLEEVAAADAWLESVGADWWTISLVTGQAGATSTLHTVRLVSDPKVAAIDKSDKFEYLISVETAGNLGDGGSSS